MATATVSQKGWVVIPAALRRKYNWKPGDRVNVVDYGGVISLMRVMRNPEDEAMGSLQRATGRRGSLTKALERERARERRLEDR
jgi:AbrB family looped-hinge helix DNA binding protein